MGSPLPMKTTCERRRSSSVRRRTASTACSTISCALRLRPNGNLPVAQNGQPIGQPACEELQSGPRPEQRCTTHSTDSPPPSHNTLLVVTPPAPCTPRTDPTD